MKMKKCLNILTSLLLSLSITIPVFASNPENNSGSESATETMQAETSVSESNGNTNSLDEIEQSDTEAMQANTFVTDSQPFEHQFLRLHPLKQLYLKPLHPKRWTPV